MNRPMSIRLNELIREKASRLVYNVSDIAPGTFEQLQECSLGTLVVFQGGSDSTIYGDSSINHAFRAIHDSMHLRFNLPFTFEGEKELGRITASLFDGLIADIVYADIVGQVEYFRDHLDFPVNQEQFIRQYLLDKGIYL